MPHFKYFIALLLIAGCASQDHASRSKSENSCSSTPTVGFAFDWDDNIFYMPTNIQIRHKENKEDIQLLSTGQFAVHRKDIAKTGAYKNYEIYDESFIYFGDDPKKEKNFLLEDIKGAISSGTDAWQGPAWGDFVEALKHPYIAENLQIITARRHSPSSFIEALSYLKGKGYIDHLPQEKNIWPVNHPNFRHRALSELNLNSDEKGSVQNPSAAKTIVMLDRLKTISNKELCQSAPKMISSRDSKQKERTHLWGFSDDDFGNFEKAKKVLQKELNQGKWKNVKITLFFTGVNVKDVPPHALVLRANQEARKFEDFEDQEWKAQLIYK